jgi:hypothetical protein
MELMNHDNAMKMKATGLYDVERLKGHDDPTFHCDNKCLRAGHCMGGMCNEYKVTRKK